MIDNLETTLSENKANQLPETLIFDRIRQYYIGDLHVHNAYSLRDGHNEEVLNPKVVARYARFLNFAFLAPSNHTTNPGKPRNIETTGDPVADSLSTEYTENQNIRSANLPVLNSLEANIFIDENGDSSIDVPNQLLSRCDIAIASIHAIEDANKRDPKVIKSLLTTALRNPYVEVGHPYRHIEMWDNDWNFFFKYYRDNDPNGIYLELLEIDSNSKATKDYAILKKIIGKEELAESDQKKIIELRKHFNDLNEEYWNTWDEVLDEYVKNEKCFEINLNTFNPNGSFYQKLLKMVVERNIPLIISSDFHNKNTFKDIPSKSLKNKLPDSLNNAASAKMIRRMLDLIDLLEENKVNPFQIINSSVENLENYRRHRNLRIGLHVLNNSETFNNLLNPDYLKSILGEEVQDINLIKFVKTEKASDLEPEKFVLQIKTKNNIFFLNYNSKYDFSNIAELSKFVLAQTDKPIVPRYRTLLDNTVLISESMQGDLLKLRIRNPNENIETLKNIGTQVGRLISELHSIKSQNIKEHLNSDNSTMRKILSTMNADTINQISKREPELGQVLSTLAQEIINLEDSFLQDRKLCLIHGDFHPGNIIITPNEASIIDIKNMVMGLPERDLASMIVQFESQQDVMSLEQTEAFRKSLLSSYSKENEIDIKLLEFYIGWISFRNALYLYSKIHIGNSMDQKTIDTARRSIITTKESLLKTKAT